MEFAVGLFAVFGACGFCVRALGKPALEGVEEIGVAVHFLILDECPAEDELRDED